MHRLIFKIHFQTFQPIQLLPLLVVSQQIIVFNLATVEVIVVITPELVTVAVVVILVEITLYFSCHYG